MISRPLALRHSASSFASVVLPEAVRPSIATRIGRAELSFAIMAARSFSSAVLFTEVISKFLLG